MGRSLINFWFSYSWAIKGNLDLSFYLLSPLQLFDSILLTLPRQTGGGGKSSAEVIDELSADILSKFPPPFDIEMVMNKYPVIYEESMNTVLRQELIRFNRLTDVVRSTLQNLQKAIKVMNQSSSHVFRENAANWGKDLGQRSALCISIKTWWRGGQDGSDDSLTDWLTFQR